MVGGTYMGPERASHLLGVTQQIDDGAPRRPPSPGLRFPVQSNMKCPPPGPQPFLCFTEWFSGLLPGPWLWASREQDGLPSSMGACALADLPGAAVMILASRGHCLALDLGSASYLLNDPALGYLPSFRASLPISKRGLIIVWRVNREIPYSAQD